MHQPFPSIPDLAHCLRQLWAQVPSGRVTTCGDLAKALGNKVAAAWIGYFSLHHEHNNDCPCHRIIRAGGMLGPYITTPNAKAQRLAEEGMSIKDGVIDLKLFGFTDFVSDRPLERLRRIQEEIQTQIVVQSDETTVELPSLIGGVDVAYPTPEEGVAAYALVDSATQQLVWSTTVRRRVAFPYISTYLSFREIPILLDLLDEVQAVGRLAEVLLVDGSGVLHHRHAGIASHLGVVAGIATVGVTKKLLCGQVDIEGMKCGESRPVIHEGQAIGIALRTTSGSRRPIFISPGHRVSLMFCERLTRQFLAGRRLPEPIYWADRLSKKG